MNIRPTADQLPLAGPIPNPPTSCLGGQVQCLGMTFENNEARRAYFLDKLRAGLEELQAKLGGIPFTSVDDAVERMRSVEHWPMGDEGVLRQLAQRIRHGEAGKDLLERWKDEVGFPHGKMEDILALSDPPYYTACPNPFIEDFIRQYGKRYDPATDHYHREPFAADVSEGKNDPIYNAHSYHTKVPHKAIMRYILHYTEPGDVVFDGFCGTGMTGVAAQLCGNKASVEALGYRVDDQGVVYLPETGQDGGTVWQPFARLGARRAVLNDLSPAATFIASNFNRGVTRNRLAKALQNIQPVLSQIEQDFWTVEVKAEDTTEARIAFIVWSDIFICENCSNEIVFWDAAVNKDTGKVDTEIRCHNCGASFAKRQLHRPFIVLPKPGMRTAKFPKLEPVLVGLVQDSTTVETEVGLMRGFVSSQHALFPFPEGFPDQPLDRGWEMYRHGMGKHEVDTHWQLYLPGTAGTLIRLWKAIKGCSDFEARSKLIWVFTSILFRTSKFNRRLPSGGGAPITGVLYIPSVIRQENPIRLFLRSADDMCKRILHCLPSVEDGFCLQTEDLGTLHLPENSLDYAFIDPPFGSNIFYADMNFLWESWLRVMTNRSKEAIVSDRALRDRKSMNDYGMLMLSGFRTIFHGLKPGRWLTVEFHNSSNAVWNVIQEALQIVGFIIGDIRTLDKRQKSFRQTTAAGAVKQDLIISAYKPNGGLEDRFKLTAGTEDGVWDFIRTHLKQLPVFVSKDGQAEVIAERQNYLLFDRMVAFHVQRGVTVPLSAAEFYGGLTQRFPERDGMYFLPEQVAEYDKKRMTVREVLQLQLFVTDESSAIQWLKQQLTKKPQTFQELHPQFMRKIGGWQKHEKPLELKELLEQNFLMYDGTGPIPPQLVSWMKQSDKLRTIIREETAAGRAIEDMMGLNTRNPELLAAARDRWYVPDPKKAGDLEKLRERALLREFEEYKASSQRRLKVFRMEAVRAGFRKAWHDRDYQTIISVARKIPENVLQEDEKLLMWYDQALTRMGVQD